MSEQVLTITHIYTEVLVLDLEHSLVDLFSVSFVFALDFALDFALALHLALVLVFALVVVLLS